SYFFSSATAAPERYTLSLHDALPILSGEEQAKLHSRMAEWVGLSPQQRSAARLNYGETKKLSSDDKKAKWEAYQALPPEEKKKLDRKSTRLNSSHVAISYAVFCLKKK